MDEPVGQRRAQFPAVGRGGSRIGGASARALRQVLDESGDPEAVLLHFARSATAHESAALRKGLRRTAADG